MGISNERLVDMVSEILYDEWDPIGLKQNRVKNQYNRYAIELVQEHSSQPSEEEILVYLKNVFWRIFGRGADDWGATIKTAHKLSKLFSSTLS